MIDNLDYVKKTLNHVKICAQSPLLNTTSKFKLTCSYFLISFWVHVKEIKVFFPCFRRNSNNDYLHAKKRY